MAMAVQETEQPARREVTAGLTQTLVNHILALRYEKLPAQVVQLAKQCFLDWVAITLAGSDAPLVKILIEEAHEQGGNPQATLIGHGAKVSTQQAALINGAASHVLDYDDVHIAITGHPTVTIVPAILAVAESNDLSGKDFITAFVAGYETACRIGALVNPAHYERGFHATATIGTFGSAAACAKLLNLDDGQTANALGIAATQAAGLKSMFGTMCKPFHAGNAAQKGLLAASLAKRGFDSRRDAVECPQGFARAFSDDFNEGEALAEPDGGWHIRANLFKYHAACYLTHAAIECANTLRQRDAILLDAIEKVTIRVAAGCDSVCNIPNPTTGLEAKFSLRLTTALALAGWDTAAIETYADETCADPVLVALRDKITVELDPTYARTYTEVTVNRIDGAAVHATHDSGIPATDLDAQQNRLETKFNGLVAPILGHEKAKDLQNLLLKLERHPTLNEITAICNRTR